MQVLKKKRKPEAVHFPAAPATVSDINITPMIDILLVLLIIFMLVTPTAQKGVDIALPKDAKTDAPPPPPGSVLVMEISETGSVSINKTPMGSLQELDQRLRDIYQTRSDKTLFVKGALKSRYGKVVEAMDIARGAGVTRVGIISELGASGGATPPQ
jgi:biopolymer transport protein ExbD